MTPGESRRVGGKEAVDSREKDTVAEAMKMSRATCAELLPVLRERYGRRGRAGRNRMLGEATRTPMHPLSGILARCSCRERRV